MDSAMPRSSAESWRMAASRRCSDRAWPSSTPRSASSTRNGALCAPRLRRPPIEARTTRTRTFRPRATRTRSVRVLPEKATFVLAGKNGHLPAEEPKYTMAHPVDEKALAHLLEGVADGDLSVKDALDGLRELPYQQVEEAKVDHHRELRTGQAEAVYGPGKTPSEVRSAMAALG